MSGFEGLLAALGSSGGGGAMGGAAGAAGGAGGGLMDGAGGGGGLMDDMGSMAEMAGAIGGGGGGGGGGQQMSDKYRDPEAGDHIARGWSAMGQYKDMSDPRATQAAISGNQSMATQQYNAPKLFAQQRVNPYVQGLMDWGL